jgi:hypothetical protein
MSYEWMCVYICMHIYICIYIYVSTYIYIFEYCGSWAWGIDGIGCIFLNLHILIYHWYVIRMNVCVYMYAYICIHICIYIHTYLRILWILSLRHWWNWLYLFKAAYTSLSQVYMYIYLCPNVCIYIYIYMYLPTYISSNVVDLKLGALMELVISFKSAYTNLSHVCVYICLRIFICIYIEIYIYMCGYIYEDCKQRLSFLEISYAL